MMNMQDLPQILARRVTNARERTGKSRRTLARESGNSPGKIDNLENAKYTNLKHGPCVYSLQRIASALNLGLSDLLPSEIRPDVMAFLRCHPGAQYPDTHISVFGEFLDFCDTYSQPKNGLTHLKKVGPRSFLARRSGYRDSAILNTEFKGWSRSRRGKIYKRQCRAWDNVKLSELDFFNEDSGILGERYKSEFVLGACRARDFDGESVLVILCEPV